MLRCVKIQYVLWLLTLDDFVVLESPQHGLQRFLNIFFDVKVDVESFHSWVLGWDLDPDP